MHMKKATQIATNLFNEHTFELQVPVVSSSTYTNPNKNLFTQLASHVSLHYIHFEMKILNFLFEVACAVLFATTK